jgi:hypothetical protein
VIEHDGRSLVNVYVPVATPAKQGDPSRFLNHLKKVLPIQGDQDILLAYMAACVQYKGIKFQWAPLLQGVEGNGKTLFTRCIAAAIGERYVHMPPASEISEKFNAWLFNTLFIGVEDIYVPEHKRDILEILKPYITGDRLAKRAMQQDQVMQDVRCNFMFNSNHKDAIRKTRKDRRFAVFFTAQQEETDLARDGMTGSYFPDLYRWLREEDGYAIVTHFLQTYPIPDELNPAGELHRAPNTSSTDEAIQASLGSVEQEIMEAINEGRHGFAGDWISSMALDRLLQHMRMARSIPHNKRREILQSMGYDWHPGLVNGRVDNYMESEGGKPKLFIRRGNPAGLLRGGAAIVKAYEDSQKAKPGTGEAAEVFSIKEPKV